MAALRFALTSLVLLAACTREPQPAAGGPSSNATMPGAQSAEPTVPGVAGTSQPAGGPSSQARSSAAAGGGTGGAAAGAAAAAGAPAAGSGGSGSGAAAAPGPGVPVGGAAAGPIDAGTPPGDGGTLPSLGPDCDRDPLASEEPFERGFYRAFQGLFGCTAPADLALYRELLPMKFDMPEDPEVCFYIIDFEISSVGPYHEAAILLPITYAGVEGKYVLSMALDNQAATSGGRAVGFPKYIGEVALTQDGTDWVGEARNGGEIDLRASYTGECRADDVFPWPDFINLTPIPAGTPSDEAFLSPRTGSAVLVPAEYLVDPAYFSLRGSVQLEIADDLPWNGLVDETKPFPGHLVSFKGGIDLGNRRLD